MFDAIVGVDVAVPKRGVTSAAAIVTPVETCSASMPEHVKTYAELVANHACITVRVC